MGTPSLQPKDSEGLSRSDVNGRGQLSSNIFFPAEKKAFCDGGGIAKVMTYYWVWNELQQRGDLVSTDEL